VCTGRYCHKESVFRFTFPLPPDKNKPHNKIKRTNNKPSITFKFLSCIIPPKKIAYSNFPNNLLAKTIPFS